MGRKRDYEAFGRAVERAIPGAAIEAKDDGELVIYTGLVFADEDQTQVRPMTEDEFMGFAS